MSDATLLVEADLSAARAKSKDIRKQLRALEEALGALATDVLDKSSVAAGRLMRARVNVARAIDEILCTDGTQMPF
jgi:hypothetical protein